MAPNDLVLVAAKDECDLYPFLFVSVEGPFVGLLHAIHENFERSTYAVREERISFIVDDS